MSNLYSQYQTDKSLETTGVILEFGHTSDGQPISIRIARAGGANSKFTKLMESRAKPYRRQIQNETIESSVVEKMLREVYAEAVVLGWENVHDANDQPMAFNRDNCIKLFEDLPDLFREVQEQSQRVALFREELLEADVKN